MKLTGRCLQMHRRALSLRIAAGGPLLRCAKNGSDTLTDDTLAGLR